MSRTYTKIVVPALAVLFCAAILGSSSSTPSPSPANFEPPRPATTEITVSAAISLKDALDQIVALYRKENPQAIVHLNLGASGTLRRQIEQGAPVDVFISASPAEMDSLASHKLILADTRRDFLGNDIVLIVPKDRPAITSFPGLAGPHAKTIAIGDPGSVPAGKYAQEVLQHLGLFETLKPRFVFAKDVRQVLTYVATGNADAGIVYSTDARTSSSVTIAATAPADSHSSVVYPVAIIAASKNLDAAKSFENFLFRPEAVAIFQKYGFTSAER